MNEAHAAQRRYPRIRSENAVLVKTVCEREAEGFAKTRVVGQGGCLLAVDEPLGVGSGVELLIAVGGRVVRVTGRVVYEIPKAPRELDVGIEFLDLSDADREVIQGLFEPAADPQPAAPGPSA